jgi:transcriptional regulator with XRE-family HTH domain
MSISSQQLGREIRAIRERIGMTQGELARRSGASVPFISLFENGERGISLDQLNGLSLGLGVSPELLTLLASDDDPGLDDAITELRSRVRGLVRAAVEYSLHRE